jgi:hypothetical protein
MTTASYDWLEDLLVEEGAAFELSTPNLRAAVASRVATPRQRGRSRGRLAVALAVAAVIAVALTLAIEPARSGVAEFFGLIEGYEIEVVDAPSTTVPRATATPGTVTPTSTATATATPTATETPRTAVEVIAQRATLVEAEAFIGAPLVFLDGRGEPVVFVTTSSGAAFAILRYDDLDLWQTAQTLVYFGKIGPPGTVIETPLVNGSAGYWVEGPRTIRFSPDEDATTLEVLRNSLIWHSEERLYRIETDLSLEDALAIAEELP